MPEINTRHYLLFCLSLVLEVLGLFALLQIVGFMSVILAYVLTFAWVVYATVEHEQIGVALDQYVKQRRYRT